MWTASRQTAIRSRHCLCNSQPRFGRGVQRGLERLLGGIRTERLDRRQCGLKSGSNKFHGSLFEYHRNNKLTARNVFQNTPNQSSGRILPASRRNEFGFAGRPNSNGQDVLFRQPRHAPLVRTVTNLITVETPEFVNFMRTRFPSNISTALLTQFPVGDIGPITNPQTVARYMTHIAYYFHRLLRHRPFGNALRYAAAGRPFGASRRRATGCNGMCAWIGT